MTDQDEYKPAYRLAVDQLIDHIAEQGLHPGDRLPTEVELARELGTSQRAVREAIKMLSAIGRVRAERGRGIFVGDDRSLLTGQRPVSFRPTDMAHISMLFEFRAVQEGETARLAARRATPPEVKALAAAVADGRVAVAQADLELFGRSDEAFHAALAEGSHNIFLIDAISHIRSLQGQVSYLEARPQRRQRRPCDQRARSHPRRRPQRRGPASLRPRPRTRPAITGRLPRRHRTPARQRQVLRRPAASTTVRICPHAAGTLGAAELALLHVNLVVPMELAHVYGQRLTVRGRPTSLPAVLGAPSTASGRCESLTLFGTTVDDVTGRGRRRDRRTFSTQARWTLGRRPESARRAASRSSSYSACWHDPSMPIGSSTCWPDTPARSESAYRDWTGKHCRA